MAMEHVTSPLSALLLHGLFADRRLLPFGLNNAAVTYSVLTCPSTSVHAEWPLTLPCNTMT